MRNAVKQAAASGATIRGVHLTFAVPSLIEVLGSRLDFIYLDGEHGCFDQRDIETACIAAERHNLTAIARVPGQSADIITRFLDRGIQGVIVPHVESVAQAQEAVAATYYAPMGQRSFGGGRPAFLDIPDKPAHLRACNDATSLCLMIESRAGVDLAGALAAVPGVDYLSFGMMDLAQSLGHPGNPAHADVQAAVERATAAIHAAGKRVREDFMKYAWINDIVLTGVRHSLDR